MADPETPAAPAPAAHPHVPTVDFYGESAAWSTASLVHCEPLIERSKRHQWRIRPHRHSSIVQLFLLSEGSGTGRFDTTEYQLTAPCIAVIPARCVHEFDWSRDSHGYALSIASALISSFESRLGQQAAVFQQVGLLQSGESADFLASLFRQIHIESANDHPFREAALGNLVSVLAISVARASPLPKRETDTANRANHHYQRFVKMVEGQFRTHAGVANYAADIGITAAHLNAICRRLAGASALQHIHNRVLLAARRDLVYTDKSIAVIAAGLGFDEPSYFTRFFKRHMRMTPRAYRRQSGTIGG